MVDLNVEWDVFYLRELFEVKKGTRLIKKDRVKGDIPFVTAGHENSGVSSFISNENQERFAHSITIDMFGEAFYRNYTFCCDDNVHVLTPIEGGIGEKSSLFVVAVINNSNSNWDYGKQYRLKTFERHKIVLPVTRNGVPNYKFMEEKLGG